MTRPAYEYKVIHQKGPLSDTPPPRGYVPLNIMNSRDHRLETDEEYAARIRDWTPPMGMTDTLTAMAAEGWRPIHIYTRLETDEWLGVFERPLP